MAQKMTDQGIALPSWTDAASVTSFLVSGAGVLLALLSVVRPSIFNAQHDAAIRGVIPLVGTAIAAVAQALNGLRHAIVTKAAIVAGAHVK